MTSLLYIYIFVTRNNQTTIELFLQSVSYSWMNEKLSPLSWTDSGISLFCSAASVTHIIASIAHHLLQVLLQVALQLAERSPEQKNMTGRRVEVCLSVTSETKVTGMILKTATTATAPTCCLAGKSGTSFVWEVYAWGQTWPIPFNFSSPCLGVVP